MAFCGQGQDILTRCRILNSSEVLLPRGKARIRERGWWDRRRTSQAPGWGWRIRTPAYRSRVCCPTTRRIPSAVSIVAGRPGPAKPVVPLLLPCPANKPAADVGVVERVAYDYRRRVAADVRQRASAQLQYADRAAGRAGLLDLRRLGRPVGRGWRKLQGARVCTGSGQTCYASFCVQKRTGGSKAPLTRAEVTWNRACWLQGRENGSARWGPLPCPEILSAGHAHACLRSLRDEAKCPAWAWKGGRSCT